MKRSTALASVEPENAEKCLLCNKIINEKSSKQAVTHKAWEQLINNAKKWSEINIDINDDLYEFTNVYRRISGKEPFGKVSSLFLPIAIS